MGIVIYRDSIQGRRLLGRIDYERARSGTFRYDEQYLIQAQANGELGVSECLPLDDEPYLSADFAPFFRGLLPEGETYEDLVNMYQLPRNNYLSMLERLGCESIGALTFVSERVNPDGYIPKYSSLGVDRVESLREFPAREVLNTISETRLSLPGAQSKVAWFSSFRPKGEGGRHFFCGLSREIKTSLSSRRDLAFCGCLAWCRCVSNACEWCFRKRRASLRCALRNARVR